MSVSVPRYLEADTMTKFTTCLLIVLLVLSPVYAADDQISYTPYSPDEFSPWMHDMRRAETIFFGSLPVSFAAASLSMLFIEEDYRSAGLSLGITLGISAAIAVADYMIGLIADE